MQYFDTSQRTQDKRVAHAARPAEDLANEWDAYLPDGPEKSVALRKLLEAKDAACRASLALECEPTENDPTCCQAAPAAACSGGGPTIEEVD